MKLKKGISTILAFILLCSTFAVTAVPVNAAEKGFYDFGGAADSKITTDMYATNGITSGTGISQNGCTFSDLVLVSDGNSRVYWGQSAKNIGGTEYTGYFHTNGPQSKGAQKRCLKLNNVVAGDVIEVVVSAATSTNGLLGLEIYDSTKADVFDSGVVIDDKGAVEKFVATTGGTYIINAYSSTAKGNIYRVTVSDSIKVKPTYMAGADAVSSGTVTINDKEYAYDAELNLIPGETYEVMYKADGKVYKGSFTASGDELNPTVNLVETEMTLISLDFTKGEIISDSTATNTYYIKNSVADTSITEDYDVKIENVKYHASSPGYGLNSTDPVITLKDVVSPAKIILGTNDYGGVFNVTSTVDSGEFAESSGIVVKSISSKSGNKYSDDPSNVATLYYTGTEKATITLTGTGQIYIPYIGVETIEQDEIPELIHANTGVKINVNGAKDGDIVVIKSADSVQENKYEFSAPISGGVADFTGNNVMLGEAEIEVLGYTVTTGSPATITQETAEYTVEVSAPTTAIPAESDKSALYVGYADTEGYNVYRTVQAAVEAATDGSKIIVADGTYHETNGVTVDKNNITIEGQSGNRDNVILWDDEHEQSFQPRGFHGDTLIVNGENFTAKNITIKNNAEERKVIPEASSHGNATALGINPKSANANASATFDNCKILATRDTVYTGSAVTNKLTFNNCLITGFQDVVCGDGVVTLNDCTMNPSLGANDTTFTASAARLLVPKGKKGTVFTANNLIIDAQQDDANYKEIYLGRPWNDGADQDSIVVVNGYTLNGAVAEGRFAKAVEGGRYGYDPKAISDSAQTPEEGLTKQYHWYVRKTKDTGNYNTTYAGFDTANTLSTDKSKLDGANYKLVGQIDKSLTEDVSAIGFTVYTDDDTYKGTVFDSTVYAESLENTDKLYSVHYITDITRGTQIKVKPFVKYGDYEVECNGEAQTAIVPNGSN